MRLVPLIALSLAGCSLYFGSSVPEPGGPSDGGRPGGGPSDGGRPGGGPSDGGLPCDGPSDGGSSVPQDTGGPQPGSCGSPEVHVIGIYETSSNHGETGNASVTIDRPGDHILVLSAYEPTNWHVSLAAGATVRAVQLFGYSAQTVDLAGVPVTRGTACGYSYPYNGGGCDTNQLLALAEAQAGAGLRTFHGCYQASSWTLHADGTATSNCNTAAGYQEFELFGTCHDWERFDFSTLSTPACTGERFIRHDDRYGVWVGAILCGSSRSYKLYMSATRSDPFLEIADYAGHGQDHCELVNRAFTIPNEDDIQSGGCTDCSLGQLVDPIGVPVYARANFGQPFERVISRYWADLTTTFYSCGVAIP
jgi:hypothetical protein